MYWKSKSSELFPFWSTRDFCSLWARLRTPALLFNRCSAPDKKIGWLCLPPRSVLADLSTRIPYGLLLHGISKMTNWVVVLHCWRISHLHYVTIAMSQSHSSSKLNRVFFPRWFCQARSLGCGFVRWSFGTVRISLIHSCTSKLLWLGIWLPSFNKFKIEFEIHNRVKRIRICGLPRILTLNKLGFEPSLTDPLMWWNSTFLMPFDPPLSARYREQSLLCFASRLSRRRTRWLIPRSLGGPSNQVVLQVTPNGRLLKRYTCIKPCVTY